MTSPEVMEMTELVGNHKAWNLGITFREGLVVVGGDSCGKYLIPRSLFSYDQLLDKSKDLLKFDEAVSWAEGFTRKWDHAFVLDSFSRELPYGILIDPRKKRISHRPFPLDIEGMWRPAEGSLKSRGYAFSSLDELEESPGRVRRLVGNTVSRFGQIYKG